MPTRKNMKDRLKKRREEAVARQEARSERTDKQQLNLLIKRGHGDCKEARRLGKRDLTANAVKELTKSLSKLKESISNA